MIQQNNEFEKWWKHAYPYDDISLFEKDIAVESWQASKADSERQTWKMIRAISLAATDWAATLKGEIAELQAKNNLLREALERALEDLVPHHTKASTYKSVNEALASTPAVPTEKE